MRAGQGAKDLKAQGHRCSGLQRSSEALDSTDVKEKRDFLHVEPSLCDLGGGGG